MLKCKNFDHGPLNKRARGTGRMANCLALTVFSTSDGHESRQKLKTGEEVLREEHSQKPHSFSIQEGESWVVKNTNYR
jgi:hypothetical protein